MIRRIVGAVMVALGTATAAAGQTAGATSSIAEPRAMATGTRNPAAGSYPLDTIPTNAIVIVPPQCVGATRCPLVIALPPGKPMTDWLRPVANKYGLIMMNVDFPGDMDLQKTILEKALQRFAIDPAKIAVVGHCGTIDAALLMHFKNPHVFSRVALISAPLEESHVNTFLNMPKPNGAVEFLVDGGIDDNDPRTGSFLRRRGNPVKLVRTIRDHEYQWEDYDHLGHWLAESWRIPDPAARPRPAIVADPLPLLTPEVLAKMAAFWTAFQREPDSIRTTARRAHLREVLVPIPPGTGDELSTWMTDMAALAAHYPSVATALKRAGLTAWQHDAYRVALLSSLQFRIRGGSPVEGDRLEPTSVLAKNIAFRETHPDEYVALEQAGTDPSPEFIGKVLGGGNWKENEKIDAKGIWHMP